LNIELFGEREFSNVEVVEGVCKLIVLPHFWSGSCKIFIQISVTIDFNCRENFPDAEKRFDFSFALIDGVSHT
jgi:hypothetical protein